MKRAIFLSTIVFINLFISCDSKNESEKEDIVSYEPREMIDIYMDLKDALVSSNSIKASQYSFEYKTLLDSSFRDSMDETLLIVINNLVNVNDIKSQRKYFEQVSELMYGKLLNSGGSYREVYKQYCPMAFNNQGAFWLSYETEILNPYFGDQMLRCGLVQDTIDHL